jgi:hypothetical protein
MYINNYFNTTIWSEQKPEFIKSLNKASNKYIKDARNKEKAFIKEHGDFGRSYHSTPLTMLIIILETLEIILVKSLGNI